MKHKKFRLNADGTSILPKHFTSNFLVLQEAPRASSSSAQKIELVEQTFEELVRDLKSSMPKERIDASVQLSRVKDKEKIATTIPELMEALEDDYYRVRMYSAIALGNCGNKAIKSVPEMCRLLYDGDNGVREETMEAVQKIIGDPITEEYFRNSKRM